MKHRLNSLLPGKDLPFAGTFHSLCFNILRGAFLTKISVSLIRIKEMDSWLRRRRFRARRRRRQDPGQLLAQLDDRELRIEKAKWSNRRDQYDNRWREASATHDLTAMQIIGAQLRQSEAQLALVTEDRPRPDQGAF